MELVKLSVDDLEDLGSAVLIKISDTKTKKPRSFTITGDFYKIFKSYYALRPLDINEKRFFINYQNEKCTRQPVGINKIGSTPKIIATFLGLKNPELYTGHCYRRSSATIFVDAGGDITALKRHGGWRSTSVAEGYIEESVTDKMNVANKILKQINEPTPSTSSEYITKESREPEAIIVQSSTPPLQSGNNITNETISLQLPQLNVSNEQSFQAGHPINFHNCSNNNITIKFVNEIQK